MVANTNNNKKKKSHSLDKSISNEEVEEKSLQPNSFSPQPLLFKPKSEKEYALEDYESEKSLIQECFKNNPELLKEKLIELDDKYYDLLKQDLKKLDTNIFFYEDNNGNKKVSIDEVSSYLLKKYDIKTQKKGNDEKIYIYYGGIWLDNGDRILKEEIERLLNSHCKINVVREVVAKIKRKTYIDFEDFNKLPEGKICLLNGVYDLYNNTFEDFNQNYYFKSRFDIFYNPKAKCKDIIKFFKDTFYEDDLKWIQEWVGFCFVNKYLFKKSMILLGPTNTGKTVFMNIITRLIGICNVSNLSLQELSVGKSFDMLSLKDRFVNIYDDLKSEEIKHTGVFKMLTGGSLINAEFKFGERFSFFNFAKLIFACNSVPDLENDNNDEAYYDKWLPAKCDNQVRKEDRVNNFDDMLCSMDNISGLFNWALVGLRRLLDNNGFSYGKSSEDTKKIMVGSSFGLSAFVSDFVVCVPEGVVRKDDFYEVYLAYCNHFGSVNILSRKQLSSRLLNVVPYVRSSNRNGVRFWVNLGFDRSKLCYVFGDLVKGFGYFRNNVENQTKVVSE